MKKLEIIDKEFLDYIKKNSKIHKENLENDLIENTNFQVKVINRIDRVRRELAKAYKEYNEVYAEKWRHYTYQSETVYDTEKEKEQVIQQDDEIKPLKDVIDGYELDMKRLNDLREMIKEKYWNISKIIDWEKFKNGE